METKYKRALSTCILHEVQIDIFLGSSFKICAYFKELALKKLCRQMFIKVFCFCFVVLTTVKNDNDLRQPKYN